MKKINVVVYAALVILLLTGWIVSRAEEIRARRLVITDDRNRERIVLEMEKGVPSILMMDDNGVCRMSVVVEDDGAVLMLRKKNGRGLVMLGGNEVKPAIVIYKPKDDGEIGWFATETYTSN